MNIRVDLNTPIKDGTEVVFRSPVDCSQVTGLLVYYNEGGNTLSKEFAFADAHGNNVGDIDHLFAENVVVKVILDVTTSMAFVQNADTNAYLEGRFKDIEDRLGNGGSAIPDYVQSSAKELANKVRARQNGNSFCFAFLSDAHIGDDYPKSYVSATHAGQALSVINKHCKLDFVAHGGDYTWGGRSETKDKTFRGIDDYREIIASATPNVPNVYAVGNHDDIPYASDDEKFTQDEIFGAISKLNLRSGFVCNPGCNYGYFDLDSQKIRIILIDSHDRRGWSSANISQDGDDNDFYLNVANVSPTQLDFIATKALDFSAKSDPSEWRVIGISHAPLGRKKKVYQEAGDDGKARVTNTENVPALFDAYNGGYAAQFKYNADGWVVGDYNDTDDDTNGVWKLKYDFSKGVYANRAYVVGVVHGDAHSYIENVFGHTILSIGCPNVIDGREGLSTGDIKYEKNTPEEGTSFCVITVDTENHKIYADHYGAGIDREWTYISEMLPNKLDLSKVQSGKNINANSASSEYGGVPSGNSFVTDFIDCQVGAVVTLRNILISYNEVPKYGVKGDYRFAAYDKYENCLFATNFSNLHSFIPDEDITDYISVDAEKCISSFTLNMKNVSHASIEKFRISSRYISDNSVITVKLPPKEETK